jgi:hypothetical protein
MNDEKTRLVLKGQCHEIFCLRFFIKHLLLLPIAVARKDFEFFQIFMELFLFLIDSLVIGE